MDSTIEVERQNYEELERLERALYSLLSRNQATQESRLKTEHKASQILDRISSRVTTLNGLYSDEAGRKLELDLLSAQNQQNDLSEFYTRLVKIQEHHVKYPDALPQGFDLEMAAILEDENLDEEYQEEDPISLLFSGEEAYGKYLDLYANHSTYCNLRNVGKRPTYLQYLDILLTAQSGMVHEELPKECKASKDYELYINTVYSYLLSFTKRTRPLEDHDVNQKAHEAEFDRKWEAGEFEGWEDKEVQSGVKTASSEEIWCAACQKMYSKKTVYDAHLTSKRHLKATARQAASGGPPENPNGAPAALPQLGANRLAKSRLKASARLTFLTSSLLLPLASILNDTKSNIERRFSLTAREREQELLEQAKPPAPPPATSGDGNGVEEEEEEERIYNPLKLPLGWDGKPIPYWLYKLHGLGVEYRCEICSGHAYMGRKNFDRHFQESRHAFGMRALGLPNTKHFHEITVISDALELAEKLKKEGRLEIFEQETMEELEDEDGNVYNRKTYEDLKKQGLI